jgi:hypothetical protein
LDQALGIGNRNRTIEVEQAIALLGVELPFMVAARTLERLTGLSVSDQTVQEVTEKAGREAQAMSDEAALAAKFAKLPPAGGVLDWRCDKLPVLYVQPDGSMVPMRPADRPEQKPVPGHPGTHREAKAAVIFWGPDVVNVSEKRRIVLKKTYVATMGGIGEFRDKVWATTCSLAGQRRFLPVIVGDGADWITGLKEDIFPDAIRIVDFFHVMERIYDVANLLHGSSSVPGHAWAKAQKERLKASKLDEVLMELEKAKAQQPSGKGDRKPLGEKCDETARYIRERREFMDYRKYLEEGLMIGSGIIESSHKRVIGQRLKGSGMHWSKKGANAMVHLRALHLSDGTGWDRLWERLAAA